ncbi:hypothetical protein [Spirochaeta cellobiosiphila]|uniref:hypothetical protein n=1 Tax=Spirochaeta cellobiosiphila TaxID=504483 RepID=UPI000405795B|nr:hypothetical protein [Spirochaeta cellobiosiphila]
MVSKRASIIRLVITLMLLLTTISSYAEPSSKDKRYAKLTADRLDRVVKYLDSDVLSSAQRDIASAEKYLGKISDEYKSSDTVKALITRFDALSKQVNRAANQEADRKAEADALREETNQFHYLRGWMSEYPVFQNLLLARDNKFDYMEYDDIVMVRNRLKQFKAIEKTFNSKFPLLIKEHQDIVGHDEQKATVGDYVDVFAHADSYFEKLINGIHDKEYVEVKARLVNAIDYAHEGKLSMPMLIRLCPKGLEDYTEYQELLKSYKENNLSFPSQRSKELDSLKDDFLKALVKASKDHKWNKYKKDFPYHSKDMDTIFNRKADYDQTIQVIATIPEDKWTVYRNALGTILYEAGNGYVIMEMKGSPVAIGVPIQIQRPYNGSKFVDANVLSFGAPYLPFPK